MVVDWSTLKFVHGAPWVILKNFLIQQSESILITEDLPQALFRAYLNRQFGTVEEREGVYPYRGESEVGRGKYLYLQNPLSKK